MEGVRFGSETKKALNRFPIQGFGVLVIGKFAVYKESSALLGK